MASPPPAGGTADQLSRAGVTSREADVLAAVADRLRNAEIAQRLSISVRTVESHVSALLHKLGAADRGALVSLGAQLRHPGAPELPAPVTSFVGRGPELAAIRELLATNRMVTLTGPGGVGKTRLALRAAAGSPAARLADVAALGSGDLVAGTIARALGVAESPGHAAAATLRETVRDSGCLLVVDSCEHLVADVARLLGPMLTAPGWRVLATSREPVGVPGEVTVEVPPLEVPEPAVTADELRRCAAVRLFLDRATRASTSFELTDDNADAVAELCRRLDGLPLALELAAARVRAFSPRQLLGYLDRRFDLLTEGARTAPERHRTLVATVDWSYHALTDDERLIFQRLAVFPGTFDYAAVEAVCSGRPLEPASIMRVFPRVLGKSLVSADRTGQDVVRYRLLDTLRAYAGEHLGAAATDDLRARHAEHYLAVAEEIAPQLRGPDQQAGLDRLTAEQANLRAALGLSVGTGALDIAMRFVTALALFWSDTGQRREAAGWVARVFAAGPVPATAVGVDALAAASLLLHRSDPGQAHRLAVTAAELAAELGARERASAALALGWALAYQGHQRTAARHLHSAMAIFDEDAHPWERATTLQGLAVATPDLDRALADAEASAALFRRIGDRSRLANVLFTMADGALNAATRLDEAEAWLLESLQLAGTVDSGHDRAHAQLGLARVAWHSGSHDRTRQLLEQCLPMLRRFDDQRCTGRALQLLGELARQQGDVARAAQLLHQSAAAAGQAADHSTLSQVHQTMAALRASATTQAPATPPTS